MNARPDNVNTLLTLANWAAAEFQSFTPQQVQHIVQQVSQAALEKSEFYADWAVKETGFGNLPDKTLKNQVNATAQLEGFDFKKYCGASVDHNKQVLEIPKPAGVIAALIPSTSPVATIYYKVLSALMTRNAVILCPHPGAKKCSIDAADYLAKVAENAGAPKGAIQTLRSPSVALVGELMGSQEVDLILATGGPAMVRAAYSSGNPALGVGPGNVACYVDMSADLELAAQSLVQSKSFDNSLLCTCESVVIAHEKIADDLAMKMQGVGGYHVAGHELEKLRHYLYPEGKLNPKAIGKDAQFIASQAGFRVPPTTKVLGVEIARISPEEPFSKEKLFPVLAMIKVSDFEQGLASAHTMLRIQGKGHSAAIHSSDEDMIAQWGISLPVCRITVNAPAVFGSSGVATNLTPSPVIGTGFYGRSSISDNVAAKHLVQWTRVAWNKELTANMHKVEEKALERVNSQANRGINPSQSTGIGPAGNTSNMANAAGGELSSNQPSAIPADADLQALIKQLVQQELQSLLENRQ
ncbi:aldehyde dehydrogenase family protein [Vibrio europaeus]|uniref:aldehyde dehydrogenase family protein n=1 Tax=Vibrio europaeus TaxID=300876 RepID=UPI00233EF571|nr:aldehyde dehydrogenase family protein [Vibrio europaeus]MDC5818240.1 aldehyde dehydrogenase family protein [Vibrio europaeus]MDC5871759.1 aldehyde dehydrogenase family protein [Vibrio europaeus]